MKGRKKLRILAIGDLVGEGGVKKLKEQLPKIRQQENIDFVIVNAENSAGGMGITTKIFNELKALWYSPDESNKNMFDLKGNISSLPNKFWIILDIPHDLPEPVDPKIAKWFWKNGFILIVTSWL